MLEKLSSRNLFREKGESSNQKQVIFEKITKFEVSLFIFKN
jgi:hypothetical protein